MSEKNNTTILINLINLSIDNIQDTDVFCFVLFFQVFTCEVQFYIADKNGLVFGKLRLVPLNSA